MKSYTQINESKKINASLIKKVSDEIRNINTTYHESMQKIQNEYKDGILDYVSKLVNLIIKNRGLGNDIIISNDFPVSDFNIKVIRSIESNIFLYGYVSSDFGLSPTESETILSNLTIEELIYFYKYLISNFSKYITNKGTIIKNLNK